MFSSFKFIYILYQFKKVLQWEMKVAKIIISILCIYSSIIFDIAAISNLVVYSKYITSSGSKNFYFALLPPVNLAQYQGTASVFNDWISVHKRVYSSYSFNTLTTLS